MTEPAEAMGGTARERVVYEGRPGLDGLLMQNFFLTLITIGIYRFWAATRLRRYLWSNIRIGGDGLEYTGTGRELFLGFLVAFAVLAPLSIAYIIVDRLSLGSPVLSASVQGIYFLALFVFLQVALFRSRRYRLSRTAWRGIYAGQTGSTWTYLGLFLGYGALTVVTLGVALPWMQVTLARYKLNNTTFGNRTMRVEAKGGDLLRRWLVVIVLLVAPLVLAILPNLTGLLHSSFVPADGAEPGSNIGLPHPGALAFVFLAVPLGGLALVWYRIEAFRYLASRVRLGPMQLHSGANGMSGVGRVLLYCLGIAGIMILVALALFTLTGVTQLVVQRMTGGQTAPGNAVVIHIITILPIYIVAAWVIQLVTYLWLWIPIIRHLATTLDIENFAAANEIAQSTQPRQKLGIADSFELGAF